MASDAAATSQASNNATAADNNNNKEQTAIEYNTRWNGYTCMLMFSGINFISIADVPSELRRNLWGFSMLFGILTFVASSLILIQDRSQSKLLLIDKFNYTKCKNGKVEGCTLVFMVLWWIVGVGCITNPTGIAYTVNNIYYSSWLTLFACIYTLNEWSGSKGKW